MEIKWAIYDPPQPGFPFVAVVLAGKEASTFTGKTRQEVEALASHAAALAERYPTSTGAKKNAART